MPTSGDKVVYLIEKNMPGDKMVDILKKANLQRESGKQVNIVIMKKNKKFQKEQLATEGYNHVEEFFIDKL